MRLRQSGGRFLGFAGAAEPLGPGCPKKEFPPEPPGPVLFTLFDWGTVEGIMTP